MSEKPLEHSTIPGFPDEQGLVADSTPPEYFKAFYQSGRYIGTKEGYGATISNRDRLFYSTREPVGVWWIKRVAYDIWDNWFRVVNLADKNDKNLDSEIQKHLLLLNAKQELPRETVFERRYGTSLFLLSYTGFGDEADWEKPLYDLQPNGEPPQRLRGGQRILQITPYPWTKVEVNELDNDESSLRCGLPVFYTITIGSNATLSTVPSGKERTGKIKVHWTRVIHDAPRLDEHTYESIPAIDEIFDDLVGARNARWGAYQSYYRHGTGFPVITTKATKAENEAWIAAGGLDNYLNVRGYFIHGPEENFEFKGAQTAVLNPNTYFDMYFTFIAAATGVAKDTLQGVSAGRVTGSEVNERQYYKSISLHQSQKEPLLRELIDRLIQTGQVDFDGEYAIEWVDPFEVNPQDKAAIEFMLERTRALKTYMTINEIRAEVGLEPIDGGDILMSQPGQFGAGGFGGQAPPNQKEPKQGETKPEEGTPNESTLFDRVLDAALNG